MKVLIAVAPDKFRDEEFSEPVSALQKAGIAFDIASTKRGTCTGMMGAKATATLTFEDVDPGQYDGLIIVGGPGSQLHLWDDELLIHLTKYFHSAGKLVAAICLAPVVLARAGILKDKNVTYFASPASTAEMKKTHAILEDKPVVADGLIITANGPSAAKEFAGTVVSTLRSSQW
jgi:protease I